MCRAPIAAGIPIPSAATATKASVFMIPSKRRVRRPGDRCAHSPFAVNPQHARADTRASRHARRATLRCLYANRSSSTARANADTPHSDRLKTITGGLPMSFDLILGGIVAVLVLIYLLAVLAQPERY
ncbi:hypothetical protein GCM10008023_18570 [Sphingomonas glacialis]|uniref:Potassium-transporting ATPase subunit F n=1 Tax=Sphingomonas glacialis TaxID=658225 RepID=A0ABQ3LHD1_9SPHN|nr:hypothetical protein GCM10008023_18570 [Sphingomonas glacialis]